MDMLEVESSTLPEVRVDELSRARRLLREWCWTAGAAAK